MVDTFARARSAAAPHGGFGGGQTSNRTPYLQSSREHNKRTRLPSSVSSPLALAERSVEPQMSESIACLLPKAVARRRLETVLRLFRRPPYRQLSPGAHTEASRRPTEVVWPPIDLAHHHPPRTAHGSQPRLGWRQNSCGGLRRGGHASVTVTSCYLHAGVDDQELVGSLFG